MADHPQAMADLRTLLARREPLYAKANLTIDTSGRSAFEIVDELSGEIGDLRPPIGD